MNNITIQNNINYIIYLPTVDRCILRSIVTQLQILVNIEVFILKII